MSNVSGALEALIYLKNTLITFKKETLTSLKYYKKHKCYYCYWSCMRDDRLIKHKSMIHPNIYTEEELYVKDIDPPEHSMKCNICEKKFSRIVISWDIIPMLIWKINKKENTKILKKLSKPLQYEYCHKTFTTKFNHTTHNLTDM